MMANDGPVCDRCGVEQANFRFCPRCQLFVCSACWQNDEAVCLSCARPNLPGPGQVPLSIRGTIGQRSLGASTSASRLGQALAGPTGEVAPPAGRASGGPPGPLASRRSRLASAVLIALATSALLLVALYGGPVLSHLLADDGGAPSPSVLATQESAVQGQRSSPKPARRTYVVRAGDTLRSIAVTVYGDEERWNEIYRANRTTIRNPDELKVGTSLVIP